MPKGEMMNLVRQNLKSTGQRMIELADQITEGGQHLTSSDAKLARMAMIPVLEESFSEFVHFYMLDIPEAQAEAFSQLDRIAGMRF